LTALACNACRDGLAARGIIFTSLAGQRVVGGAVGKRPWVGQLHGINVRRLSQRPSGSRNQLAAGSEGRRKAGTATRFSEGRNEMAVPVAVAKARSVTALMCHVNRNGLATHGISCSRGRARGVVSQEDGRCLRRPVQPPIPPELGSNDEGFDAESQGLGGQRSGRAVELDGSPCSGSRCEGFAAFECDVCRNGLAAPRTIPSATWGQGSGWRMVIGQWVLATAPRH
jgi:hypothetical protein